MRWEPEIKYKEVINFNYLEMRNRCWYHWLCCHAFIVLSMMKNEMDLLSINGEEKSFNFMIIIEIMPVHLKVYDPYCSTEKFCFLEYLTIHLTAFMRCNAELLTRSFNLIAFYKEIIPLWVLN